MDIACINSLIFDIEVQQSNIKKEMLSDRIEIETRNEERNKQLTYLDTILFSLKKALGN